MSTELATTPVAPRARQLTVAPGRALAPLARRDFGSALPPFPSHALLDAPAPRTRWPAVFGSFVFLVFVVGFGVWSAMAPLAEAAIAPGVIKVEGNRRTVQHLEGGIVREILVRDGSKVEPGQVLMRLDDVQSDTTAETQRAQRWALMAQDARLVAELGKPGDPIAFPPELLASTHPRARDAVRGQLELHGARTASLNSQLQVLRARIDQQQAAIRGARGQIVATGNQLGLVRQEESIRRNLVGQGLGRLPELLQVQRAMAALEGTMQDLNGQVDRANATISEAERQIQQVLDQRQQEVSTELREVRGRLADAEERLRAASRRADPPRDPGAGSGNGGEPPHLHARRRGAAGRRGAGDRARQGPAGGGGQHPALRHRRGLSRPAIRHPAAGLQAAPGAAAHGAK